MSVLHDERSAIVNVVAALGIAGHDHLPGRLVPPCAIVIGGSPYIERRSNDPFGSYTARFDVQLVVAPGPNDVATEKLDEFIETVAEALLRERFALETVQEPFVYQTQNANYLATVITVTTTITLN